MKTLYEANFYCEKCQHVEPVFIDDVTVPFDFCDCKSPKVVKVETIAEDLVELDDLKQYWDWLIFGGSIPYYLDEKEYIAVNDGTIEIIKSHKIQTVRVTIE